VVSIDARDGEVVTDGWLKGTGRSPLEFAREMVDLGVQRIMYTDVRRDGALTQPNFEALAELVAALPVPVVAAGGVSMVQHLVRLAEIGCEGAIVGKALYEGAVDLPAALAAVRQLTSPAKRTEVA
jgi:phosphoribosylformimino-5-aminoimidazole carboxamide ribotide isomerase